MSFSPKGQEQISEKHQCNCSTVLLYKGWRGTETPGLKWNSFQSPKFASSLLTELVQSFCLEMGKTAPSPTALLLLWVKQAAAVTSRPFPNLPVGLPVPTLPVRKHMWTGRKWDCNAEVSEALPVDTFRHTLPKLKEAVPPVPPNSTVSHTYLTSGLRNQKFKQPLQRAGKVGT